MWSWPPTAPTPSYPPPQAPVQAPVAAVSDPRRKSPFLACLLSIMPGLGQVYVGYYQRGFIHAIVIATLITLMASGGLADLLPLASLFLAFFWLYNIIDAGRRATLYNMALAGGEDIELPQDFKVPGLGGSIVGGGVLVAVGILLLLHTRFGVSLDWVEEWWPLVLVAFGAYLLVKALKDRSAQDAPPAEE